MSRKVMIVDDEPEVRDAVCHHLTQKGMEAVSASGYEECLNHLKGGFTGVIFMDLIMPKKDGWDTIHEIVKHGYDKNASIILLTASIDPVPAKSQGLVKYVADYIHKPTDLEELVKAARKYLS
jgi:DNA-binding response OmpR family regulator